VLSPDVPVKVGGDRQKVWAPLTDHSKRVANREKRGRLPAEKNNGFWPCWESLPQGRGGLQHVISTTGNKAGKGRGSPLPKGGENPSSRRRESATNTGKEETPSHEKAGKFLNSHQESWPKGAPKKSQILVGRGEKTPVAR